MRRWSIRQVELPRVFCHVPPAMPGSFLRCCGAESAPLEGGGLDYVAGHLDSGDFRRCAQRGLCTRRCDSHSLPEYGKVETDLPTALRYADALAKFLATGPVRPSGPLCLCMAGASSMPIEWVLLQIDHKADAVDNSWPRSRLSKEPGVLLMAPRRRRPCLPRAPWRRRPCLPRASWRRRPCLPRASWRPCFK